MKNYHYWLIIGILFCVCFLQGEDNADLTKQTKVLITEAKEHELNAKLFEEKNIELIEKEDSLNNVVLTLEKTSATYLSKYQKSVKLTQENARKTQDLTSDGIKLYFKDRYQDENITIADTTGKKVITDLVFGDGAKAQNTILLSTIQNKDSLIVVKDKIIENSAGIRGNLIGANTELKLANEKKDKAIENQSVIIRQEKRKKKIWQISTFVIGGLLFIK